jgi:hypothetical protein
MHFFPRLGLRHPYLPFFSISLGCVATRSHYLIYQLYGDVGGDYEREGENASPT